MTYAVIAARPGKHICIRVVQSDCSHLAMHFSNKVFCVVSGGVFEPELGVKDSFFAWCRLIHLGENLSAVVESFDREIRYVSHSIQLLQCLGFLVEVYSNTTSEGNNDGRNHNLHDESADALIV